MTALWKDPGGVLVSSLIVGAIVAAGKSACPLFWTPAGCFGPYSDAKTRMSFLTPSLSTSNVTGRARRWVTLT